ncbi:hypothetical protein [Franzmannia qiaohouensis]|uniref:Uncharacterized protein n=1 Tax=Franzmannia qiaohouensis TaxID=1329370 RepID=A0ABU1HC62_9GAMM|nr:hypothetical protein [Halomonas qiaohouensis]MDR5905061.1 hypothetical protein [Halomonas qiaohouensis]
MRHIVRRGGSEKANKAFDGGLGDGASIVARMLMGHNPLHYRARWQEALAAANDFRAGLKRSAGSDAGSAAGQRAGSAFSSGGVPVLVIFGNGEWPHESGNPAFHS